MNIQHGGTWLSFKQYKLIKFKNTYIIQQKNVF